MKILFIDDNNNYISDLEDVYLLDKPASEKFLRALNGEQAEQIINENSDIDVFIIDGNFPYKDYKDEKAGFKMRKWIKNHRSYKNRDIYTILFSGYPEIIDNAEDIMDESNDSRFQIIPKGKDEKLINFLSELSSMSVYEKYLRSKYLPLIYTDYLEKINAYKFEGKLLSGKDIFSKLMKLGDTIDKSEDLESDKLIRLLKPDLMECMDLVLNSLVEYKLLRRTKIFRGNMDNEIQIKWPKSSVVDCGEKIFYQTNSGETNLGYLFSDIWEFCSGITSHGKKDMSLNKIIDKEFIKYFYESFLFMISMIKKTHANKSRNNSHSVKKSHYHDKEDAYLHLKADFMTKETSNENSTENMSRAEQNKMNLINYKKKLNEDK